MGRNRDAGTPTRGDTVTGKHPKFRIAPAFAEAASRRQGVRIAESKAKGTRRVGLTILEPCYKISTIDQEFTIKMMVLKI